MFPVKWKVVATFIALFISVSIAAQHRPVHTAETSIDLDRYRLLSRVGLAEVDDNLSGIT
ncbi:MAG: hypothetical protein DRQ61_08665 [Gammaproteobacteria bacterium]|nr:MAG: hypothetical protein DRQ56_03410 [Gammaproteobacteria bacterium]RLA21371.1 MAG: hypothetical protein DRQ61_08665 [Gammaproteobacteria bacterium]